MKAIYYILAIAVLALSACTSSNNATSSYDDIYYEPNDKYLNDYSYQEEETAYEEVEEQEQEKPMTNKYEESGEYSGQQEGRSSQSYRNQGGNGDTYINNYYEAPYDYFYSSRIRRFHRPYSGFSYYSGAYTSYRSYDPYYNGVSIYVGWGNPGYGYSPYSHRYNRFPYHSYHYNSWYNDPWYSPYGGYGSNYWSYRQGYRHGYYQGFYNGYYQGTGGYYGYNNGNYGKNENTGHSPSEYYYGTRYASGSNSGMQSGRSNVKYGKDNDKGSGTTTGSKISNRGEERVQGEAEKQTEAPRKVGDEEKGNLAGKDDKNDQSVRQGGLEANRKEAERKASRNNALNSDYRTVRDYSASDERTRNASTTNRQTGSSTINRDKTSDSKDASGNRDIRRNDFVENTRYQAERRAEHRTGQSRNYEPFNSRESQDNSARENRNAGSSDHDRNVLNRENDRSNRYTSPDRNTGNDRNRGNYQREERNSRNYSTPSRERSSPSRDYSTPDRNRNSAPSRNYSAPDRDKNSSPKRNYSAPERNSNSGSRNRSIERNNNNGSRDYSTPSRNRSSDGNSGGSSGGSINRSSSPSKSSGSSGGRRNR